MLPIRKILHPTDFSPSSDAAFFLACSLARDYNAHLVLLHVKPLPEAVYGDVGVVPPEPEGVRDALQAKLEQMRPHDASIEVEYLVKEGDAVAEIVRTASDCDLIVMGTHGRTGLRRLVMGSVAEWVTRRAPCPVLTVKMPPAEEVAAQETELATAGRP